SSTLTTASIPPSTRSAKRWGTRRPAHVLWRHWPAGGIDLLLRSRFRLRSRLNLRPGRKRLPQARPLPMPAQPLLLPLLPRCVPSLLRQPPPCTPNLRYPFLVED